MSRPRDLPHGRGEDEAAALVAAALRTLNDASWRPESQLRELPQVQAILQGPAALRRRCLLELADRRPGYDGIRLLSMIARKRVELSAGDVERLLSPQHSDPPPRRDWWRSESLRLLRRNLDHAYRSLPDAEKQRLKPLLERAAGEVLDAPTATWLRQLVGAADAIPFELIHQGDDVGQRLRGAFENSDEPGQARAAALALLAAFPPTGRPSKQWHEKAGRVRDLLARPAVLAAALLDAALDASETGEQVTYNVRTWSVARYLTGGNEPLLCGAAAFAGVVADPALLPRLRRLALKSATVIGGQFGAPRSLRLANACAQAIADAGAASSITELLALERAVRHGTLLNRVRRAIEALAAAQGMTREQLLERSVEAHQLDPRGKRRVPLSRGAALLEVDGRTASLTYLDEHDTPRRTVPADVKQADAGTLAALREDLRSIRKTIAGERHRLEGLVPLDRRWTIDEWRALYLDHPITGRLTRRLVWGFRSGQGERVVGIPRDARTAVVSSGAEVAIPGDAEVLLWHPVHGTAEEVRAWRRYLLEQQVVQPFKQAFRELYVLTPAEAQTRVYSNRFAGHVFRQVQARALMKGRGWQPVPVAWWDDGIDHGVARRTYEPFGIRAELFFDPILDIEPDASDLYPYCTSDQVRFFDVRRDAPIELADVPSLVFTEAMRDVDLFVGVTSIGADPAWLDRGEGRRFETYWSAYSFGALTAAGEVRREVLEQLLPRLAIADRCELEERFLTVRGDLRTYRIHLGSGNILMSPNDQYLCIVAARDGRAEKLFLPFDDDPVLSLILSKAFLLADDTAITDQTITAQIGRR